MGVSVSGQALEFLYSALLGLCLGVLFDIIRVLRSFIPKSRVITAVLDILFWCVAIIALMSFVLTVSGGQMRWYVLVGVFSGGFVYVSAVGAIVYKILRAIISVLKKVFSLLMYPVHSLLRGLWRLGKRTERKLERNIRAKRKARRMLKTEANASDKRKKVERGWRKERKKGARDCSQS